MTIYQKIRWTEQDYIKLTDYLRGLGITFAFTQLNTKEQEPVLAVVLPRDVCVDGKKKHEWMNAIWAKLPKYDKEMLLFDYDSVEDLHADDRLEML